MAPFSCLVEQDFVAVLSILTEAGLPVDGLTPSSMLEFIGLRVDGDLAAFAGLERYGQVGLLRSVVVRKAFQRGGIGGQLIGALEGHARTRDVQQLVLLTTTAERFFMGLGYIPAERTSLPDDLKRSPEFATACPASAVCLIKLLSTTN